MLRQTGLLLEWRQACRVVVRDIGASVASVLVIAVGTGLTVAMFALADPYINGALPYPDPWSLVVVTVGRDGITRDMPLPTLDDWAHRQDAVQSLAAVASTMSSKDCQDSARVVRLLAQGVSKTFLATLGVRAVSPNWAASDQGQIPTVVTSSVRRRLGYASDESALGHVLACGSDRFVITGVLPETFRFPDTQRGGVVDVLIPYAPATVADVRRWESDNTPASWEGSPQFVGRLASGRTAAELQAALAASAPMLQIHVERLADRMAKGSRRLAATALAGALLVLLISAGNFANIFGARTLARLPEMATRSALGANSWQLVRAAGVELILLGGSALGVGLAFANLLLAGIRSAAPAKYLALGEPSMGLRTYSFWLASGALVLLIAAIPAAVQMLRLNLSDPRTGFSRDRRKVRATRFLFTAVQAALAMIMFVGASLAVYSQMNLLRQTVGLDPKTKIFELSLSPTIRPQVAQQELGRLLGVLRGGLPGDRIALTDAPVVDAGLTSMRVQINGEWKQVDAKSVTSGFFDVAGMHVEVGRDIATDAETAEVVVSRALADRSWPGRSPLGEAISLGRTGGSPATVVGVVNDVFDHGLDVLPKPTLYLRFDDHRPLISAKLLVVSALSVEVLTDKVHRALLDVDPTIVLTASETIGRRLTATIANRTFATTMLAVYASVAAAIAFIGIGAVVLYATARRASEMALRAALGASRRHLLILVSADAMTAAAVGAFVGMLLGHAAASVLSSLAYGVEVGAWSYALIALGVFVMVAAGTAVVVAARSARAAPSTQMRME